MKRNVYSNYQFPVSTIFLPAFMKEIQNKSLHE
jgi:hypothetical protein